LGPPNEAARWGLPKTIPKKTFEEARWGIPFLFDY